MQREKRLAGGCVFRRALPVLDSFRGCYAGENRGKEHKCEDNSGEPVSPGGVRDVSGFYDDSAYGERLDEHLNLPRRCSGKVNAFGFGDVSDGGNIDLSEHDDADDRPKNNRIRNRSQVKQLRLFYDGEANKAAADENFIGERVQHSAEFTVNA